MRNTFGRQAIPMVWSFAEANPFSNSTGNWHAMVEWVRKCIKIFPSTNHGFATQANAFQQRISLSKVISTDPPYYDNICYADLSDFFYIWLKQSMKPVFPDLFNTLATPKSEELVATPYRHTSKAMAETFFMEGMTKALCNLSEQSHHGYPLTVYYAYKQAERTGKTGVTSTGWETFLDAIINAGFSITGTWPMRTELSNRMVGTGTNALASSVVLVCRLREANAPTITYREMVRTLRNELPKALQLLQAGNIAPVDLAQAAIGPGMKVYTRYAKVLDATGQQVSVRDALALINQILSEVMDEQEGDLDEDSRWALHWFKQYGFSEGEYGDAESLSKAKNTSVNGMVEAGILTSQKGKARLLRPNELPSDWDPATDDRLTVWEAVHHLIRILDKDGEKGAGHLVAKLGGIAPKARELCYKLFLDCDRNKRAGDAMAYNAVVQSWPEIMRIARSERGEQGEIF